MREINGSRPADGHASRMPWSRRQEKSALMRTPPHAFTIGARTLRLAPRPCADALPIPAHLLHLIEGFAAADQPRRPRLDTELRRAALLFDCSHGSQHDI